MTGLRSKLLFALLITTVAGCSRPSPGVVPPHATGVQQVAATRASGRQLVALWDSYGGLIGNVRKGLNPPKIAVYSDGLVVASAERRLTLKPGELDNLLGGLRKDLAGQPASPTPKGGPHIYDATTTLLGVRDGRTMRTVAAYALEETRSQNVYPKGLYHARDALAALADRIARKSTPYTAGRVLLIAQPRPGQGGKPWPAGVPEPSAAATGIVTKKLSGAQAKAAIGGIHRDGKRNVWPSFHDHHGHTYVVSWRYLLPSE
ncbi:hypothetical protein [Sphaerisporangium fuscum]|uniref:hypothetical protein n=1 Tax=Sphaerisporangium fuscum TaxID=2835868 RepID=UPI001BDDAE31|nr:hypothetical protein [Sphaerisporangium fuscum]